MSVEISSITSIPPELITDFANRTWGELQAQSVLSEWWLGSPHAETMVAFDKAHNRLAGIVVAVKSRWTLPDRTLSDAVSICGWYVAPEYAGQGLGRLLVRYFDSISTSRNTLAITEDAVRAFHKLGWRGPFRTQLLCLPLPALRRSPRVSERFSLTSYAVRGNSLPDSLCSALEHIEATKPAGQARRLRSVEAWRSHLGVWPEREHQFHVVLSSNEPIGAFVLRKADVRAAPLYRRARLVYVTDLIINHQDTDSTAYLSASIGHVAPKSAGALILCTSNSGIATAFTRVGWLSEKSPLIGNRLAAKAPLYMLDGRISDVSGDAIDMTFMDSDVDLNL